MRGTWPGWRQAGLQPLRRPEFTQQPLLHGDFLGLEDDRFGLLRRHLKVSVLFHLRPGGLPPFLPVRPDDVRYQQLLDLVRGGLAAVAVLILVGGGIALGRSGGGQSSASSSTPSAPAPASTPCCSPASRATSSRPGWCSDAARCPRPRLRCQRPDQDPDPRDRAHRLGGRAARARGHPFAVLRRRRDAIAVVGREVRVHRSAVAVERAERAAHQRSAPESARAVEPASSSTSASSSAIRASCRSFGMFAAASA